MSHHAILRQLSTMPPEAYFKPLHSFREARSSSDNRVKEEPRERGGEPRREERSERERERR